MQWGKDRPPTGQFDNTYSPQAPATPGFAQASPAYGFPQYGAPVPMTPQAGPHSAGPMGAYAPNHQSPGPVTSPTRGYGQVQGGFPSAGFPPHGYGQMPGSAGGYGHDQNSAGGWAQGGAAGFPRQPPAGANGSFAGY
jgi:hypothetical protein